MAGRAAKDVILKVAGILTVKGGTGAVVEYFGEGCSLHFSATGKGTICNMGAEIGATTSIFEFDEAMARYLRSTRPRRRRRPCSPTVSPPTSAQTTLKSIADPDQNTTTKSSRSDLDELLEPHVNGPFTPDRAMADQRIRCKQPRKTVGPHETPKSDLIGSCTNSSYEDLSRAAERR
jgi:aconitate hydratase